MLRQPWHCWVCCHSWNQWWQIHRNSPLWRLRVLQTDMIAQVCEAPQCCVTSGSLLWGKPAGSHRWIYFVVFLSEGVRSHQAAGTLPRMFSNTDVSGTASSWLEEAHLCNLEMTPNHRNPFASINHWAKWRQGTGEGWVCDQVEVEKMFKRTGLVLPGMFNVVQFERLVDKLEIYLTLFPFYHHHSNHRLLLILKEFTIPLLIYTAVLHFVPTQGLLSWLSSSLAVKHLSSPPKPIYVWNTTSVQWAKMCTVTQTPPPPPLGTLIPSDPRGCWWSWGYPAQQPSLPS